MRYPIYIFSRKLFTSDLKIFVPSDVEPPTIECPGNFVTKTDDDMYFATVNFTLPKTSDNSGRKPRIWSTPPFEDNYPLRFSIGETDVQIHSEDEAGNREICSFTVKVKGEVFWIWQNLQNTFVRLF